jgi:hypothetical protein
MLSELLLRCRRRWHRAAFTVLAALGVTACANPNLPWNQWPTATVRYFSHAGNLAAGIDRHCLSAEQIDSNVDVAVVSYKVSRKPRYLALPLGAGPEITVGARATMQPGSCRFNSGA